ncbi:MAG: DUF2325 domain-containing protein [Janthinobacterium lividum]
MCEKKAQAAFIPPAALQQPQPVSIGSRRRRLWDLPDNCHCPVVGVCLPLRTMRKLMSKIVGDQQLGDYDLHTGAVSVCNTRNHISDVLQRELELRYAVVIKQFKAIKDTPALAQRWDQAIDEGDVTGAFWAGLTHPHCNQTLQEKMCRDMHMLQHQAGAHVRVDMARMQALVSENAVLTKELGRVQERITRLVNEKMAEIGRLNAALMQSQAELVRKDTEINFLKHDMAGLEQSIPGLLSRVQLSEQLDYLRERNRELERGQLALRQQLEQSTLLREKTEALEQARLQQAVQLEQQREAAQKRPMPATDLQQKIVLCVGGRDGNLGAYRDLVECAGGQFEHHDGGREDNLKQLNSNLTAADVVICQTGCISHNAYWRVKDHCKRHGKPCVFLENPSATSMARSLEALSGTTLAGPVVDSVL